MPEAFQKPDLTLSHGAFEVGIMVVMLLTGIATLQIWNYYRDHQGDPMAIILMVTGVYLADVFHSALLAHSLYSYTITSFGDYVALQSITWSLDATLAVAGFITFCVQTYFCVRIYKVTSIWLVAFLCWTLALTRFICDVILCAKVAQAPFWLVLGTATPKALAMVVLCVGAGSDILIAGVICLSLARSRSGFASTDKLLDRLVMYTIASGLLTSVMATTEAIMFVTRTEENFAFMAIYCILPKLFSNSLLASLNERGHIRREVAAMKFSFRSGSSSNARITFERNMATEGSHVELSPVRGQHFETKTIGSSQKVHEIGRM